MITLIETTYVSAGPQRWRLARADTGKILGYVQKFGTVWRTQASMRAFLGDGPAGGEPLGDRVPLALYEPLGHLDGGDSYLPGSYPTRRLAEAALQRYLIEQRAPVMGYGPHPRVRKVG